MEQISLLLLIVAAFCAGAHGGAALPDTPPPLSVLKKELENRLDILDKYLESPADDLETILSNMDGERVDEDMKKMEKGLREEIDELISRVDKDRLPEECSSFADEVYQLINKEKTKDEVDLPNALNQDLRCIGRELEEVLGEIEKLMKEEKPAGEAPAQKRRESAEKGGGEGEKPRPRDLLEHVFDVLEDILEIHEAVRGIKEAAKDLEEFEKGAPPADTPPADTPPVGRSLSTLLEELLKKRTQKTEHALKRNFDSLREYLAKRHH